MWEIKFCQKKLGQRKYHMVSNEIFIYYTSYAFFREDTIYSPG
jgi:hypothetical protein